MNLLSGKIKDLRKKAGLSQKKLAELSGVSFNTIVNIESGKNKNPGIQSIYSIARVFNVKIDDLTSKDNYSPQQKYLLLYQRDLPPLPILLLCNAYTKDLKMILQDKWPRLLITFKKGYGSWFFGSKDLERLGKKSLELISQNNQFLVDLHKKFITLVNDFTKNTVKLTNEDYKRMSNKKLISLFNEYCNDYQRISAFGEIVPFCLEPILTDNLNKYLDKKFVGISNEEKSEVFATLSAFTKISFVAREELDLYRIGLKSKSQQKKLLLQHYKKYLWVPFDYVGPAWDKNYFEGRLVEINRLSKTEIKNKVKELRNQPIVLKEKQKKIIKKYNFPEREILEFTFLQQCSWLYDQKKEYLTQAHYHLSFLLKEVARRLKVEFLLIYYALPGEITDSLQGKRIINNKLLSKRKESSFMIAENGQTRYLNRDEVKKWIPHMETNKAEVGETKIAGLAVSPGKIKAKVSKILLPRHIGNMRKGDVLVTTMTSVNFVPVMRLASAIVTDLGGITSHAAIVSRELGIPCIVGTKNATKIFEDGDLIEVDAQNGKAKLIKR